MTSTPAEEAGHLVPMPGGGWAFWRIGVLRGAGFPALDVLDLAAPRSSRAAQDLVAIERRIAGVSEEVVASLNELARREVSDERRRTVRQAHRRVRGSRILESSFGDPEVDAATEPLRRLENEWARRRDDLFEAFREERAAASEAVRGVLRRDDFREALAWQNRRALASIERLLLEAAPGPLDAQRRRAELTVANYFQRYTVKNDTIGFFGPVGWARLDDSEGLLRSRPGPEPVSSRSVHFEAWAIDALADRLGDDSRLEPWLFPRLLPRWSLDLEARMLYGSESGPRRLSREQARLLAACDGERTAREIADELVADEAVALRDERQVLQLLATLRGMGIVAWRLEVHAGLSPEAELRRRLERVGDPRARHTALMALERVEAARDAVAEAAGDGATVTTPLGALDDVFEEITGRESQRGHGRMYAARGLVYEDCRRDLDLWVGRELVKTIGPPISLLLDSARWLAATIRRRAERRCLEIVHRARDEGSEPLDSFEFFKRAASDLWPGQVGDWLVDAGREFSSRWRDVLAPLITPGVGRVEHSTDEVRDRVRERFPRGGSVWALAHHLSPDILIAAAGLEAIHRGDYELVLGEIHYGNSLSWSSFISQHPEPEILRDMAREDTRGLRVVLPQLPRSLWPTRNQIALIHPEFLLYQFADELPRRGSRPVAAGDLVVEQGPDGVVARPRNGGEAFPAIELIGLLLTQRCSELVSDLLPPRPHRPRVTLDGVVVLREAWSFPVEDLEWAGQPESDRRFLAVRRWAESVGIGRFAFYKVASEPKPIFLDLAAPHYVDLFAKTIARERAGDGGRVRITEMLPAPNETWLIDAEGRSYTSELRLVAIPDGHTA